MPLDPELLKGKVIRQDADGGITIIPPELADQLQVNVDRGARRWLTGLTAAAGIGLAAEVTLQLHNLARDCLNENALWSRVYGVPPVGLKTCVEEGFSWLMEFVKNGGVWR